MLTVVGMFIHILFVDGFYMGSTRLGGRCSAS